MPPKSRTTTPAKPSVASRGAFDALAVEGEDGSDDDRGTSPSSPTRATANNFSASTKKGRAKQRARDRAKKQASGGGQDAEDEGEGGLGQDTESVGHALAAEMKRRDGEEESGGGREANGHAAAPEKGSPESTSTATFENTSIQEQKHVVVPPQPSKTVDFVAPPSASDLPSSAQASAPTMSRTATSDSQLISASATTSASATPFSSDIDEDETTDADYTGTDAERDQRHPPRETFATPTLGGLSGGRFTPHSPTGTIRASSPPLPQPPKSPDGVSARGQGRTKQPKVEDHGADHDPAKKRKSVITRIIWSLVMVFAFISIMMMGHVYLIILIFALQSAVFREVSNLFEVGYKASAKEHVRRSGSGPTSTREVRREKRLRDVENDRWSKVMSWYFFCAVNYFLYGESIIYYFKHVVFIDAYLLPFARHHRFISMLLYLAGFLTFVANLDRDHLRRQFGLFSWIHMSLLLIVVSSHFMVYNILEGLIWFWVPASLVIMNDVAAYVFGMLFGRHQLIQLSPKKTVEGFVGGYFATVIFAFLWASLFMRWNYMICPVRDLGVTAFSNMECVPNAAFVWRSFPLPDFIASPLSSTLGTQITQVWWTPFQLHALVLGTFAGLVAPFGGFFASGFKRAFHIKDFGDTIPGHGGLTDRFDCQFIMGMFTYFYYSSLVRENHVTVGSILELATASLSAQDQIKLVKDLQAALVAQGIGYK